MRLLGVLLLLGCATAPVPVASEDARRSLLVAHAQERGLHLARDAERIAAIASEGFVPIDGAEIRVLSVAQQREKFARDFARVTFDRWDDLEPPRVWVSADGTWGSVAVRKEVVTRDVHDGSVSRTVFAWLETWERGPRGWEIRALAPPSRSAEPWF